MEDKQRPVLGVTMGDPAGIGPEILVRALNDHRVLAACRPLVLGDAGTLKQAMDRLGIRMEIQTLEDGRAPAGRPGVLEVRELSALAAEDIVPGRPTLEGGKAAARYIDTGADLAMSGFTQGIVTAPISKESLNKAGYRFPGHTEFLAHKAGGSEVVMMLAGPRLRVVLVTIHEALRNVPSLLTAEKIIRTADITHRSMARFFGLKPRLAACALNPHAGEGGLFGDEDERIVRPAVEAARSRGIDLNGPYPADTLFWRAANGEFDAVVCMYHDQGLIPLKLLHFDDGVNVTLGLPFIRTSVDHGTAYDIAGTGKANHASLLAALYMAADMAVKSGLAGGKGVFSK